MWLASVWGLPSDLTHTHTHIQARAHTRTTSLSDALASLAHLCSFKSPSLRQWSRSFDKTFTDKAFQVDEPHTAPSRHTALSTREAIISDQFKPPFEAARGPSLLCWQSETFSLVLTLRWWCRSRGWGGWTGPKCCPAGCVLDWHWEKYQRFRIEFLQIQKMWGVNGLTWESTFWLELKTEACHCHQTAELCQKSPQSDTKRHKRKQNERVRFSFTITDRVRGKIDAALLGLAWMGATLVCALMKGNPTLHRRKSKSTSSQEMPFSSCTATDRQIDRQRVSGDNEGRQAGDRRGRAGGQEAGEGAFVLSSPASCKLMTEGLTVKFWAQTVHNRNRCWWVIYFKVIYYC